MPLTVSSKRLPDEQPGSEDDQGRRRYTDVFEVDQTDGGPLAAGVAVAAAAQLVVSGDPVPLRGDNYSYAGTTDLDAFVLNFGWRRPDPKELPTRWHITVNYGPADGINPGQLSEPNPLAWPTEYWLEWMEAQVPIESAKNVESLDQIGRAANTDGPLTNAAGEQPIDPYLKTVYLPILCCQKAYATLNEIIALNDSYEETTNNGTFFGASARKAKYLHTDNGRLQRTQGYSYYLGITRILFKKQTHDLKLLNNGFNCFVRDKTSGSLVMGETAPKFGNPFESAPKLFRFGVQNTLLASDTSVSTQEDFVPSSEPMNLNLDGTARLTSLPALNLTFRHLAEVNYAGIGIGS